MPFIAKGPIYLRSAVALRVHTPERHTFISLSAIEAIIVDKDEKAQAIVVSVNTATETYKFINTLTESPTGKVENLQQAYEQITEAMHKATL